MDKQLKQDVIEFIEFWIEVSTGQDSEEKLDRETFEEVQQYKALRDRVRNA